jgi:GNAT superfamily N-acetyltransferase
MIAVRRATGDDADRLAELRWEFRSNRATPTVESRETFVARCAEWMRRELGAGGPWRAWVAVDGGAIVGQLWVQSIEKIPNPAAELERHAYISNLFVEPAHRGGAGTPLLEAAIAWSRAHDVDRVILWPSARSVSLYERHGFTRDGSVMELALEPTPR